MQIEFVEVSNFRKLQAVRVELADQTTVLVGANNSGKTSAIQALRHFLVDGGRFHTNDFTLSHWHVINAIGDTWIELAESKSADSVTADDWSQILPSLDVWLRVENDEIYYVRSILPTLSWRPGLIGIRLRLEPKDISDLYRDFCAAFSAARETKEAAKQASGKDMTVHLWPSSMMDFLDRRLKHHFAIQAYVLDPTKAVPPVNGIAKPQLLPASSVPIGSNPLSGLVKIHEINAQRGFDNSTDVGGNNEGKEGVKRESRRLSEQLRTYYANHLDPFENPDPSDIAALAAIEDAQGAFDARLVDCFKAALAEVANLGYPGVSDPQLKIATRLRPMDGMDHEAAVQYLVDMKSGKSPLPQLSLPEHTNGLGYQNLVSMIFRLMSFRDAWMRVGKAGKKATEDEEFKAEPLHLVLIEEPEAHLHAQVQQVFIRKAYSILRDHPDLHDNQRLRSQMVVSTHSSHITHETDFSSLRYFRRLPASVEGTVPVSAVVNVSEFFGEGVETANFARRYLRATHCDLFFSDAAILVEGPAERMLIPHFVRHKYPDLNQAYLTLLEIGGAHAHRLEPLLRHLGLPTLVITDLDSVDAAGKAIATARRKNQKTNNSTLKAWVPKILEIDALLDLDDRQRVKPFDDLSAVRVAYQLPIQVSLTAGNIEEALPYTFEDALVLSNLPVFKDLAGTGLVAKFRDALEVSKDAAELGSLLFDALRKGKKAEFALDVLALQEPDAFIIPNYIDEGLTWLQSQLRKRQLDVIEAEKTAMESA